MQPRAKAPNPIAFIGEVVAFVRPDACEVRFRNGHRVTAYQADAGPDERPARPRLGEVVRVEMGPQEMRGWRLRRP